MKQELVIVGAGFGGMYFYRSLSKKTRDSFNITLVDQRDYFLFTPLLHEVATGTLDPESIIEPLKNIIHTNDTFVQTRVQSIDLEQKTIEIEDKKILNYDVLVLGVGSKTNFYNVPGAQENSFELKTLDDAIRLREHFEQEFEKQSLIPFADQSPLNTVVIGGGPTGVEIAGELTELFGDTFKKIYQEKVDFSKVNLHLVNASNVLLKPYSLGAQKYAKEILEKKGVRIISETNIVEINEKELLTQDGTNIPASTVIWAAGVASENLAGSESFLHADKRIEVSPTLQLQEFPEVFVIGDMARVLDSSGNPYPMLAQVAKRQGIHGAKNLGLLMNDQEPLEFTYQERGRLASLGQWTAIAEFPKFQLYGHIAWFVWRTIYLFNFPSYQKRLSIMVDWTKKLFSPRSISQKNKPTTSAE